MWKAWLFLKLIGFMLFYGVKHLCLFSALYYSSLDGGKTRALSSESKIDQADFTRWLSFLPSNFMEEIIPNLEAPSTNNESL